MGIHEEIDILNKQLADCSSLATELQFLADRLSELDFDKLKSVINTSIDNCNRGRLYFEKAIAQLEQIRTTLGLSSTPVSISAVRDAPVTPNGDRNSTASSTIILEAEPESVTTSETELLKRTAELDRNFNTIANIGKDWLSPAQDWIKQSKKNAKNLQVALVIFSALSSSLASTTSRVIVPLLQQIQRLPRSIMTRLPGKEESFDTVSNILGIMAEIQSCQDSESDIDPHLKVNCPPDGFGNPFDGPYNDIYEFIESKRNESLKQTDGKDSKTKKKKKAK